MVAVRDDKLIAALVTLALVAGPAGLGAAVTEETTDTVEPDCYPADDGTDASICVYPDTCATDLSGSCVVPDECERVDDRTVRCSPSDDTSTDDSDANGTSHDGLIYGSGGMEASGEALVDCRLDNETDQLVCRATGECREQPKLDHCVPPEACEPVGNATYRCLPPRGSGPPDHAQSRSEQHSARGTGDGSGGDSTSEEGPDCRAGGTPGTVICEPPTACEGRIGATDACTPPPECEARDDGTFLCEVPDRGQPSTDDADASASSEVQADAKLAVAQEIQGAAESFRTDLASMRQEYGQQVDDLRAEYADGKAQLRADYEDCRAAVPDDADASEREERLQDCVDEARADLATLRGDLQARHDEIRQAFKDRAEQARQDACQEAENAALGAVADRGLFDANPAELVPESALSMCPSLGDFDRGGEAT